MNENEYEHADLFRAMGVMDALPSGTLQWLRDAAKQLGTGILPLLLFLAQHPELVTAIAADAAAKNWTKMVQDIVAAWNQYHPVANAPA